MMNIALVYPPFVPEATAPPLGISLLKPYLQQELPGLKVRLFDLNIDFYHDTLAHISDFSFYPQKNLEEIHSKIKEAAGLFLPPEKDEFYHRKAYDLRGALFIDFFQKVFRNDFSALRKDDYSISSGAQDRLAEKIRKLAKKVLSFKPDVVGISVMYTTQCPYAIALAKIFKEKGIKVVFGGAKISFYPGFFAKFLQKDVDYLIIGEGELPFKKLLQSRCECEEKVIVSDTAVGMDSLPTPDFGDLDLDRYFSPKPIIPLLTSKGCFWQKCTFCNHHRTYSLSYRPRRLDLVLEDIETLKRSCRADDFYLCDEMISAKRMADISSSLVKGGIAINYLALAKPTEDFSRENLAIIARGGCKMLLWGVESGSQKVLDLMMKGTRIPVMEKVLQESKAAGIKNFLYMMTGFPGESRSDLDATISFLARNSANIDFLISSPFNLEENAPIFQVPQEFGVSGIRMIRLNDFQCTYEFERNAGMTSQEVKTIDQRQFYRFNKYPLAFTRLRDHLFLYVCRKDKMSE